MVVLEMVKEIRTCKTKQKGKLWQMMKVLSQKGHDKFIFKWVIQLLNVGIGLRKTILYNQTGEEVHTWL